MNPLRSREFLIPFDKIKVEHIEPGVREALAQAQASLEAIIAHEGERTYDNTIAALDDLQEKLGRVVSVAYHLNSVMSTPELRTAFNAVLPEISAFYAKLGTNEGLWQAVKSFAQSPEAAKLTGIRKRHVEKLVQEFKRAGADLPADKKSRAEDISVELSQLHTKFSENVLDATNAYELIITDEAELAGLPASAKAQAKANAEAKNIKGYRFTLQMPSYYPFMQYAQNRELRQKLYTAFVNRAASGDTDNRPLIYKILELRKEYAALLGYKNFADYRLEVNMVKDGAAAQAFEAELKKKTEPYWQDEIRMLTEFAQDELGLDTLEAWDVAFVIEKLRKARFDLDQEELRPYFPVDRVLAGLFEITHQLFGITVSERDIAQVWHPDVKFYDIHDEHNTYLGSFYADWFPRESKRAGAWMNSFITGGPTKDGFAPHLGLMCGNFTPPQDGQPALLSHREVQTTFHEFGHLLHHLLSKVEVAERAGTNVPRDWVELPSQLLENWTWERDALDMFARHYQTGETIPQDLYEKMIASRTFMEANSQMRQLSFGAVDLALHIDFDPSSGQDVIDFGNSVMEHYTIKPAFAHNNFLTAFSHVFSGGYAAGYYSYKWSEVLEADAFSRFKQEGIFNRETGRDYVNAILSRGDSADPDVLFREFMGRDPDINALIERNLGPRDVMTVND